MKAELGSDGGGKSAPPLEPEGEEEEEEGIGRRRGGE